MKINKIIEKCDYSSDLGMPIPREEDGKMNFLQAGKSRLWIFNP